MSFAGTPASTVPAPGSQVANTKTPVVQWWEVPFVYEQDFPALAAGATQNSNLQIQADADFKWTRGTYFADLAGAVQTDSTLVVPLCTVQIVDSGTGRQLFFQPIAVPSYFGSGKLPFILQTPYVVRARSTLQFTVTNFSAATTYTTLRLSLIGTKLYKGQS